MFSDYGAPIEKLYRSKTQDFSNYNARKNVNSVVLALCPETASVSKLRYITDFETQQDLTDLSCAAPPLGGRKFPCVFRRKPLCRRVLHFAISLENNTAGEDLSISSAEVYFEVLGKVR